MDRNRNGWQEADRLNAISILNLLLKKLHWLFLAGMAGGLIVLFFANKEGCYHVCSGGL